MFKTIIIKAKKFLWVGLLLLLVATFLLGRATTSGDTDDDEKPSASSGEAEEDDDSNIWTCPMHPQIQEVEPGSCPICHMELVPVDDVDELGGEHEQQETIQLSEDALAMARVQHDTVKRSSLSDDIDVFGTVDVSEESEVDLTAYTGGRIERLMVRAEGERVERGDLLAQIYSPDLLEAQRTLTQAQNSLQSAREAGSERRVRAAESAMASARDRLRLLGVDQRQIDEIEAGGQPRETVDVYATASGTVQTRHVSEGDYVEEGERILSLAGLDELWAQLDIYERDLPRVREGAPVSMQVSALPGEEIEGRIAFISPEIDEQRRVARARVPLPNDDGRLRPGMYLDAAVEAPVAGEDHEVLSVPRSAVLWTGQRSLVYEYDDELEPAGYVPREVELGPRVDDHYVIEEGLEEGAEVAAKGAFRIDASLQIDGGRSMMSAERSATEQQRADEEVDEPSEAVQTHVHRAVEVYDEMRALLAADSTDGLDEHATELQQAANSAKEDADDGLAQHLEQLTEEAERFHDHSEETDIEQVRIDFGEISRELVAVVATIPDLRDELYVYECPMAQEYDRWIQLEEKMANPYMGEEMLKCGSEVDWMNV